jgi:hypothetical protein
VDVCNCEQALALKEAYLELWVHVLDGTVEENHKMLGHKACTLITDSSTEENGDG